MTRILALSALLFLGGVLALVLNPGAPQLDNGRAEASGCTGNIFCISVDPASPTEDDAITVTVYLSFPNLCYTIHDWRHAADGQAIDVDIRVAFPTQGFCGDMFVDYIVPSNIGILHAGIYEVTAHTYICLTDQPGEIIEPCDLNSVRHLTFEVAPSPTTGHCPWPPPWAVPPGDSDCDGWTDEEEELIGTDPHSACGERAWPPDLNDDGVVNVTDLGFLLPTVFGSADSGVNWDPGLDLNPDGVIDVMDVGRLLPPVFGSSCVP